MSRSYLLPVLIASALVMTGVFGLAWSSGLRGNVTVAELDSDAIVTELFRFDGPMKTSVTYLDIVDTIEEITADADLVAVVRVVSRRQYSPISVATTASVVRIVKGKSASGAILDYVPVNRRSYATCKMHSTSSQRPLALFARNDATDWPDLMFHRMPDCFIRC